MMIQPCGLIDQAIRYQRESYRAAAEAMDLRIALANMGKDPINGRPMKPTEDQILMSRRYDAASKAAADRASNALQFLLFRQSSFERAA